MMSSLAWRLFLREWRGGELGMLLLSLLMGVAIVTGIGLFADRLQRALVGEAGVYLGADAVLQSADAVDHAWLSAATEQHLLTAETMVFPTMAYFGDRTTLASLKVVTPDYPLRGALRIQRQGQPLEVVRHAPMQGEVWVDDNILSQLDAKVGDSIDIGNVTLRIGAVLLHEADAGSSFYGMGARILMPMADLPASQLLMPGSRVEYRYLLAGAEDDVSKYIAWLKPKLGRGQRLMTLHDSQPGIAGALEKAGIFLQLAGSLGVLLAALAGGFSAQRYCQRHADSIAVMKTLGMTSNALTRVFVSQMACVWLLAVAGGFVAGFGVQRLLLHMMSDWVPVQLPNAGVHPFLMGAATAAVCLLAFMLPAFRRLLIIPPSRVLRQSLWQASFGRRDMVWMALGIVTIVGLYSQSWQLAGYLLCGLLVLVLLVAGMAVLALSSIRSAGMQAYSAFRMGLGNVRRRGGYGVLQVVVFATGFMLLSVMVLLRTSLFHEWEMQVPENAPNTFLVNVPPEQTAQLTSELDKAGLVSVGFYPMIRGRLVGINTVDPTTVFDESVGELYRELNLSWSATLPTGNAVEKGRWFSTQDNEPAAVSIEQGLAKRLGIQLGDRLTFNINGESLVVQVSSLRSLRWDSMTPNFYFLFSSGVLDRFSRTDMTSLYVSHEQKRTLSALLKHYPAVTAYPVDELINRIRNIMQRASLAVETVMVLVLVSGLLVLVSCTRASLDQRLHESTLLRTLGATRQRVLGALVVEFLLVGALAGVLAAVGAEISAWAVATKLMKVQWQWHPQMWWSVPLMSAALIALTGSALCYRTVTTPPRHILQEEGCSG